MTDAVENIEKQDGPKGLGGWLLVVGLGVITSPFRMFYDVFTVYAPLLRDNTLRDLADPSSPSFVNYMAEFIYFEMFCNTILIAWAIANVVLFFSRSARFPASWRYFLLAAIVFLVTDSLISTNFISSAEAFDAATVKAIVQSLISTAIWVPYTIVSKRVKNTFVN